MFFFLFIPKFLYKIRKGTIWHVNFKYTIELHQNNKTKKKCNEMKTLKKIIQNGKKEKKKNQKA